MRLQTVMLEYSYNYKDYGIEKVTTDKTFMGYRRANGEVGIRNDIWIVNTVGCVNKIAEKLSALTGALNFPHPFGCSQMGDDQLHTQLILRGMVNHPNAGGVLVLGLGCENNNIDVFKSVLGEYDERRVKFLNCQDHEDEITELHMGAMRNNNSIMLDRLGLDTGFDSISEENSTSNLSRLLDKLNREGCLPKLILFNLNPKMNTELMTLLGCFQDGSAKGKVQFGPAWWFLDNKVGMENHLRDLTATGHIAAFVGMLTDSRSLLSYPRHHYFRRILCNYLGDMMEKGEMTSNTALVGKVVEDICINNSVEYFGI